jgi:glycosyltransferase 2 family protein
VSTLLKIVLTLLILAVLIWQLDLASVGRTLATIPLFAIICGEVAILGQSVLAAKRLASVVARFGIRIGLWNSCKITLEGMFFSQTFVSFLGGDALRIWRIRQYGLSGLEATSATMVDRLVGILVNHVFLLASLPWLWTRIPDLHVKFVLALLALAGVGGFALILVLGALRGRGGTLHRLRSRIAVRRVTMLLVEASTVGRHFLTDGAHLLRVSIVAVLMTIINMFVFGIVLFGMGVDLPLAIGCALLVPAVMEIAMLPLSIAGWGLREGAAVVAFGSLGLPAGQALGSSLAFGLITTSVSLIGGVLWLCDRRKLS